MFSNTSAAPALPARNSPSPVRYTATGNGNSIYSRPTHTLPLRTHGTGTTAAYPRSPDKINAFGGISEVEGTDSTNAVLADSHGWTIEKAAEGDEVQEDAPVEPLFPTKPTRPISFDGMATNTGRGVGGLPRTVPLSPTRNRTINGNGTAPAEETMATPPSSPPRYAPITLGRASSRSTDGAVTTAHLVPTATGTRYGVGLTGGPVSPARKFGGNTPTCQKCQKSVYFAEQVSGDCAC